MIEKDYWKDYEVVLGPPDDDEPIAFSMHGEKQEDFRIKMSSAFLNAKGFLENAEKISGDSKIVLCALSCELFMKAIIMKKQNRVVRGHDLYLLYDELGDSEKDFLFCAQMGKFKEDQLNQMIDEFFDALMINARVFETIRYKHEYQAIVWYEGFLYVLAHNLSVLGDEINNEK